MISVFTEMNDKSQVDVRGWVFFDGTCEFCRFWVRRLRPILTPRGFIFVPLQTPWVREHFHLPEEQLLSEIRLLLPTGEAYGGAEAVVALAKFVWWARPLVLIAYIPGMRSLLRAAYRFVASRRYCINGACAVTNSVRDVPDQSQSRG